VVEEMISNEAVIGGEGNGGVILPDLHMGRDAPVAIAMILQFLLESDKSSEALFKSLPRYEMVKSKIDIQGFEPDQILEQMMQKHAGKQLNLLDGLKIDAENSWVHLRKSNTEPIIRIIAEAPTKKEALETVKTYSNEIQSFMK
jgi:phosphomannomutase